MHASDRLVKREGMMVDQLAGWATPSGEWHARPADPTGRKMRCGETALPLWVPSMTKEGVAHLVPDPIHALAD